MSGRAGVSVQSVHRIDGLLGIIAAILLLGGGCRFVNTSVGRIVREAYKYEGADVTVAGRVVSPRWIPSVGTAGFCVADGRDSLLVLTLQSPPPAGSRVRLQGRFLRRFPVGDTERMVVLYHIDPDEERPTGAVDPR